MTDVEIKDTLARAFAEMRGSSERVPEWFGGRQLERTEELAALTVVTLRLISIGIPPDRAIAGAISSGIYLGLRMSELNETDKAVESVERAS